MFNNWVLDVTYVPNMPPVFVPYEDDGTLVLGMNVMSEKCPGELVGIIHEGGQEAVEKWCSENPNWYEQYSRPTKDAPDLGESSASDSESTPAPKRVI